MAPESLSPFSKGNNEKPCLRLRGISEEELRKMFPIADIFRRTASAIAKWPDFSFEARDGRQFLLFYEGTSIRHRLEAVEGCLTSEEIERVDSCWAIVHEAGSTDHPMVFYSDDEEVRDAWLEIHRLHGEPLNEEEIKFFGVANEELFGEE